MDINISSQIVVQTSAQWAADNTVYSAKRILVTSDEYYGSTDQRKFKIADGVQTWSNLDYMPIEQVTTSTIGSAINGAASATPNDTDLVMSVESSVAKKNTWTQIKAFLKTYFDTVYQAAGSYLTSVNITQTITNGVTDKAPSEDAVYDALALKANTTDTHLLFQGSFSGVALADSSTYYFSSMDGLAAITGPQGFQKFGFDKNKKITNVVLTCSQGANYSNESVSIYLRKNATTDYTITTTLDLSTVGVNTSKVFYYTVDIDVTTGDDYEFKFITPAFSTNGSASRWHIELYGY